MASLWLFLEVLGSPEWNNLVAGDFPSFVKAALFFFFFSRLCVYINEVVGLDQCSSVRCISVSLRLISLPPEVQWMDTPIDLRELSLTLPK